MEISVMTEGDLPAANELRQLTGWNQTLEDWRRLLSLEPEGCFVAAEHGDVVGTVTTTTYGKSLAWIGMMLVHPDYRRRGIATDLMQRALQYLQARGISCVKLDATPAGRPVYEKLGFVPEWTLTRWQGAFASQGSDARELTEADWPAMEKIDTVAFGVPRGRVIRRLAEGNRAMLVWPAQGEVLGYGMLRSGANSDYLGPVVGNALPLLAALLRTARTPFWDVPDDNEPANAAAKQFGFKPLRPLTRMRLGPNLVRSDPCAQWAIADPSVG